MPVILGGAPVHREAKPGAVKEGKTATTSSANTPFSMSLAKLGSLSWRNISWTKEGTAPSQARTMALGGVWPWTWAGIGQATTRSAYTSAMGNPTGLFTLEPLIVDAEFCLGVGGFSMPALMRRRSFGLYFLVF
jgi:hypothetical protein